MRHTTLRFARARSGERRILAARAVEQVVCACATDAGREGELIFRYLYDAAECSKPVRRLWISSLTPSCSCVCGSHAGISPASTWSTRAPGDHLATLLPLDKARNAERVRRVVSPAAAGEPAQPVGIAPHLRALMADYAATGLPPGLPPAYLPKHDPTDDPPEDP